MSFIVSGNSDDIKLFDNEAGGHRWQRVPPTEHRGRVHTSTITVAVLPLADNDSEVSFLPNEVVIEIARGTGPGGQHRNTTDSCVTIKHIPTGLSARCDMRSQYQSRRMAFTILAARLKEFKQQKETASLNQSRKEQIGSGQRGDKIRTYRQQDNIVKDSRTGKKCSLDNWMNGRWPDWNE